MDLSNISDIYIGSRSIGEVYKGASKLWPQGSDPVFTELHEWEVYSGDPVIVGLHVSFSGSGFHFVSMENGHAGGKHYCEFLLDAAQDGFTRILIGEVGTSSTMNLDYSGASVIIGVAVDFTAELAWWRANDGVWNESALADPATGTGGESIDNGGSNALFFFGTNYELGVTAVMHPPFNYAAPAGFGELVISGEYT